MAVLSVRIPTMNGAVQSQTDELTVAMDDALNLKPQYLLVMVFWLQAANPPLQGGVERFKN